MLANVFETWVSPRIAGNDRSRWSLGSWRRKRKTSRELVVARPANLGASDSEVERAFDAGDILRTHVMRPTWHFVAQEDLGWLLELTAPRVHGANGPYYRKLDLEPKALARATKVLTRALEGGTALTRDELGPRSPAPRSTQRGSVWRTS